MSWRFLALLTPVVAGGCMVEGPACEPLGCPLVGTTGDPPPADSLAATGLCADALCAAVTEGVLEFVPRWELWSDGATKRRWISLPAGAQIETSVMDYWRFPIGTKLWKEFSRNGVRVETRYMVKTSTADTAWEFATYAWNAEQTVATLAPPSGARNVNGTAHDIPPAAVCVECHANVKSRVLGFSAFQLDHVAPEPAIDLDDAVARGWLSAPPAGRSPHWPVPGTTIDRAALGYFHANCGHCHNSDSPLINRPMFRLEVDHIATLEDTRTYESTVNVSGSPYGGATIIAKPGDPDHSIIVTRMRSDTAKQRMPPVGIETIDPAGSALVRDWITRL